MFHIEIQLSPFISIIVVLYFRSNSMQEPYDAYVHANSVYMAVLLMADDWLEFLSGNSDCFKEYKIPDATKHSFWTNFPE